MVLVIALLLMSFFLSYPAQVAVIMLGRIAELDVLALLITMIGVMVSALALILVRVKHPPAPPYSVCLLLRQVKNALRISATVNGIDDDYDMVYKTEIKVGSLLSLELWGVSPF